MRRLILLLTLVILVYSVMVDENKTVVEAVTVYEVNQLQDGWPVGGWNCRAWGVVRLLADGYAIDLDPEGALQNWGRWQFYTEQDVIIVWMESSKIDVISKVEKQGDSKSQYIHQSFFPYGPSSNPEEVKKIFIENAKKDKARP